MTRREKAVRLKAEVKKRLPLGIKMWVLVGALAGQHRLIILRCRIESRVGKPSQRLNVYRVFVPGVSPGSNTELYEARFDELFWTRREGTAHRDALERRLEEKDPDALDELGLMLT